MGTQIQTTTDYGSLFRPRLSTKAERDRAAEARRRQGGGGNTATENNAPSAGDQSERGANYGTSAPKTFKARQKNSEYKDQINNIRQLRQLATESNGTLTFPTTELKNKFINARALAVDYENNNQQCDVGNSQACMLAGRGSFPTDYPSPFSDSIHYSPNSYFGVGDGSLEQRQTERDERDGNTGEGEISVAVAGDGTVESSSQRVQRERRERQEEIDRQEDERIAKMNADGEPPRPASPPPSPAEEPVLPPPPTPAEKPATTDGSGDALLPKHDGEHSGESGGGSTNGQNGGASGGEPTHVVPLNPNHGGIISYPSKLRTGYDFINFPSVFNNRKKC